MSRYPFEADTAPAPNQNQYSNTNLLSNWNRDKYQTVNPTVALIPHQTQIMSQ
jgi:hypothetical protein